jgi:type II secretory pathway component GspD/PulD (secretin)
VSNCGGHLREGQSAGHGNGDRVAICCPVAKLACETVTPAVGPARRGDGAGMECCRADRCDRESAGDDGRTCTALVSGTTELGSRGIPDAELALSVEAPTIRNVRGGDAARIRVAGAQLNEAEPAGDRNGSCAARSPPAGLRAVQRPVAELTIVINAPAIRRPRSCQAAEVRAPHRDAGESRSYRLRWDRSVTEALTPDELTNSLLIRASQEDFDVLNQAIDQLDIRPLQVLIEVLIVEARRDSNFSLGTSLFFPQQPVDKGNGTAGGQVNGASLGDLVIQLMSLGHADIDATLTAAASRGDVQIVSRPVLLASNNAEAHFLVGSQRPFVQVSRSLPTETPTRDQVIDYRDVGTRLTVRPTINQDGYVSLLIQQEVNQATNEVAFDAPVISTREASTQVLVKDGQTIVLGGLRDRQYSLACRS